MKMNDISIWRRISTVLCLFLLLGFTACDDDDEIVELFNEDRFYSDFASDGLFGDWDLDDDGFLDEDEFTTSYFEIWDLDDDGILEESEWDMAVVDYDMDGADWTAWDTDGDGVVELVEFDAGFDAYDYYNTWDLDGDGVIMAREYTDGVFGLWDADGDGLLEAVDYNAWYDRYYVI